MERIFLIKSIKSVMWRLCDYVKWCCLLAGAPLFTSCENKEAAGQTTTVEGGVTDVSTGRPLPGVLLLIEPYGFSFSGPQYDEPIDSARTDAAGRYTLTFVNQATYYYAVSADPDYTNQQLQSPYITSAGGNGASTGQEPRRRQITLGTRSTVDFRFQRLTVLKLRIRNRNTGYQQLLVPWLTLRPLRGNELDTTVIQRIPRGPGSVAQFPGTYRQLNSQGAILRDTTITLSVTVPDADTVQATFGLIR